MLVGNLPAEIDVKIRAYGFTLLKYKIKPALPPIKFDLRSITFHQSVDFVNHFLKNIEKYNIENNYLIIIHLSDNLYKQKDNLYKKNVIINAIHYNKKRATHLLMKPFIENFEYLISQNPEVEFQ